MLMTLVLTRSYAGNLMALLAVRHISEPYHSLREVLDDPSVTMLWLKDTPVSRYLTTVESGIFREIGDLEREGRLLWRTHLQFTKDKDTWVRRGTHVLMDVHNGLTMSIAKDFTETGECSFYESKEEFLPLIFAMVGLSPLVPALSKRITSITEAGLFFHWIKSEDSNSTVCHRVPTKVTVKTTLLYMGNVRDHCCWTRC
ncbi:putative olfactory ionotropic receptor IR7-like 5 [Homarus americanus]|uniref:Putative olfactory ionotropic receptor IR7-like 5 n=1 Tax=Homarus americanus TaxID=6706 RepID=A0A8J5MSQ9_HOMAM|nr:putative olfactory ionotropic receptor IR7-like 5 [Homarus americanus]